MKVLFIGNSHTYFNDMPRLFARMAEKTTGAMPDTVMLAYGGCDLAWHRGEYLALRYNLMYGGFDYCVFQQAAHPYPPAEETMRDGAAIADLCIRCGVKPVVFTTWAEKVKQYNQEKMTRTCRELARATGALLAPIGEVWEQIVKNEPDIDLYYTDGEHASVYGDFLCAAVLCRAVTGAVSDSVNGMGSCFYGPDSRDDIEFPHLIENPELVPVGLDPDKTARILAAVRIWQDPDSV